MEVRGKKDVKKKKKFTLNSETAEVHSKLARIL